MKVLHIAQASGGVERYLDLLLSKMDHDKFDNYLLCSTQFDKSHFEPFTSKVYSLPMQRNIGPSDIGNLFRIRKIIRDVDPDLIYCHSSKAGAIGRLVSIGLHKKLVYNAHGWAFNMKGTKIMHYLYIFVEWFLSFFTDAIVCISNSELEDAKRLHIGNPNRLQLICNGVDIEKIRENLNSSELKRNHLRIPEDAFVIGMIGRISEQKAPDVFVKMAKRVKEQVPNAYFMIIGDGEKRLEIEELISQYNLENDFFISGWVENVTAYLNLLNVGVLLSRWEGFGLALCEYMVARLPIVASRVNAIPELIQNGINGFLIDIDDYESASDAVIKIYNDEELIKKMANNGFSIVNEKFNIMRTVKQHEALFERI